jgi:hypothetical protein
MWKIGFFEFVCDRGLCLLGHLMLAIGKVGKVHQSVIKIVLQRISFLSNLKKRLILQTA